MGDDVSFEYLKLQYEEGARNIRYWIECRYKILQFVGYFNAAVLTFGFSQEILLSPDKVLAGVAISLLSFFVALMGFATESSTTSYNYAYFEALRNIEAKLQKHGSAGILTQGRDAIVGSRFHKVLPVHRAHKIFYGFLMVSWAVFFVYQLKL